MNRPDPKLRPLPSHSVAFLHENWLQVSPAIRSVFGASFAEHAPPSRGAGGKAGSVRRRPGWKARIGAVVRVITDEFLLMPGAVLVEGRGARETAERILCAAWQVRGANLLVQGNGWRWTWRGRLAKPARIDGALVLRDGNIALEVDPSRVIAVYRCGFGGRSGIVMHDERRAFLTLWSNQASAFDKWLKAAVSGAR